MKQFLMIFLLGFSFLSLKAQEPPFRTCENCWDSDSLGNHRVVLYFDGKSDVARADIKWRRSDSHPEKKRIIVTDGKTGNRIMNVRVGVINNERGEIYFEPVSGKGLYYVYYMPYINRGSKYYPNSVYWEPENTANQDWLLKSEKKKFKRVSGIMFESVDEYDWFTPMEIIATEAETNKLLKANQGKAFLVFPEERENSIKMKNHLPRRWVQKGVTNIFWSYVSKGENFSYQLGIYALQNLKDVKVQFSDLKSDAGQTISASNMSCLNTSGIDYTGKPMKKIVDVSAGVVQAMWCLIDIPENTPADTYKGKVVVSSGALSQEINIEFYVRDKVAKEHGIDDPWTMTRLKWLNSTMAQQNDVISPYSPLDVQGNSVSLLGRKMLIDKTGLPAQIQTFFTPEMTGLQSNPNDLLTEPVHFHFTKSADGKEIAWKSDGINFTVKEAGTVKWEATNTSDEVKMEVNASLEFDGFVDYVVKVTALKDVDLSNITMHIPFEKSFAKYMMGLGEKGGNRKENFSWKWDVAHKNQDGAWIGNVNGGLQYSLRDENYVRPLNTNFYLLKPLLLPTSWGNGTNGGINIGEKGNSILADNYSGARSLKKGDVVYFNFHLLITPFHPIDTDFQWATRFYHKYQNLDSIKATGATVVNIHHATPINPWINYPFIQWKKMKAYIDSAHERGLKVKIYNTIRELSNHAYETFALRSLGHEIYSPGQGGGYSWLQEHLYDDYIAAWFVPEIKDAAIINSGMNRWHNYYVEGMNWLTQNVGIDGIYLDDVAFDRVTMKRIKRVLTRDGHPGIIDLHSANQYNERDGFNNSANLYMEHFPYLNRLWFGEYFDYENNSPDFFMTEVSGIPFGLMGEMLQDGGNPWRGMIYGMTNRMPWSDNADPRPIWKVWDDFGMEGTQMIGYWSDNCPVKTDNEKVLTTVYKKDKTALISIASWAEGNTDVILDIDWEKLGIDPSSATITAPAIRNFQPARTFKPGGKIPVEKNKGWILIVK